MHYLPHVLRDLQVRAIHIGPGAHFAGKEVSAMIQLTIDGKAVSAPKGTSILKAALDHGIFIPHLCYDPSLSATADAGCVLWNLRGQSRLLASCSTFVEEDMKVLTHTPQVNKTPSDYP